MSTASFASVHATDSAIFCVTFALLLRDTKKGLHALYDPGGSRPPYSFGQDESGIDTIHGVRFLL